MMATPSTKKAARKKATRKKAAAKKAVGKTAVGRKTAARASKKRGSRKAASKPIAISLGSEASIRDVADIYQQLMGVLEATEDVTLDASEVDRIDTSVLQALVAFVRDRQARKLPVTWTTPSEAFLRAARTIDVLGHLKLETKG